VAHATPITGQAAIALTFIALALIVCAFIARAGHRFLADTTALLLAVPVTVLLEHGGAHGPAALAAGIGLWFFTRVARDLKAGALR